MQSFQQIQTQIGRWSFENFGFQETPYLEVRMAGTIRPDVPRAKGDYSTPNRVVPALVVALHGLAPLLGIGEEVGELHAAGATYTDRKDAVGDIAVYLCDYCNREGIVLPNRPELAEADKQAPTDGIVANYGRLLHCHLKRYQRIRGMHNPITFDEARIAAVRGLVWHLEAYCKAIYDTNLLTILNEVWNGIVKKRDWKDDATAGGGHSHEGTDGQG